MIPNILLHDIIPYNKMMMNDKDDNNDGNYDNDDKVYLNKY
jgi:hypothetical protein